MSVPRRKACTFGVVYSTMGILIAKQVPDKGHWGKFTGKSFAFYTLELIL